MPAHTPKLNQDSVIKDATRLFRRIEQDLRCGVRPVPALPLAARNLHQLMQDPNYSFKSLAEAIEPDHRLLNRLTRIASGSLYPGKEPCDTALAAVRRLGAELTRNLILVYALQEIFHSPQRMAQEKLHELWTLSARVAGIGFLLAHHAPGFTPERALIAGLLQNVGAMHLAVVMGDKAKTEYHWLLWQQMVLDHSAVLSADILIQWGLDQDIVECAVSRDQWLRQHAAPQSDLADLLIIARYHAYLNTDQIRHCPKFTELPCLEKMRFKGLEMTPFQGLKIVQEARQEIQAIISTLLL